MSNQVNSTMPAGDGPAFWYASFVSLWLYYQADADLLDKLLADAGTQLKAFRFDGKGLVNIDFMSYGSHSGMNDPRAYAQILQPVDLNAKDGPPGFGVEPTNECEFNIVSYPLARTDQTPIGLSLADFLAGNDRTKTIGSYRLYVPCDDRIAVYWGSRNFGENKVMTHPFLYNVPSFNNPGQTRWRFAIPGTVDEPYAPNVDAVTCQPFMFSADVDISAVRPTIASSSEIIDYSLITDGTDRRLAGSRRNVFGAFFTYDLKGASGWQATLTLGDSRHPLVAAMRAILGNNPVPVAAQTFQSQPVVAESAPYYADI
jgi:hypothetical protein